MIIKENIGVKRKKIQKEIEENNYQERKKYDNNKELLDIIKQKDKEIKQYKIQLELISEEKNKLYEDNTKMYTNLDNFQKYILKLIEENKNLSEKINKYTSINNQSQAKEMKSLNDSEINEDDINKNNYKEINFEFSSRNNNIEIEKNNEDNMYNSKYNILSESEINENNERDIKINKNTDLNFLKVKNKKKEENEKQSENKAYDEFIEFEIKNKKIYIEGKEARNGYDEEILISPPCNGGSLIAKFNPEILILYSLSIKILSGLKLV